MIEQLSQGNIYRVTYNSARGHRKNVLVLATEAPRANQYVESFPDFLEIAIPAMMLATDVHLAPEFFESYELEYAVDELDDEFDDSE